MVKHLFYFLFSGCLLAGEAYGAEGDLFFPVPDQKVEFERFEQEIFQKFASGRPIAHYRALNPKDQSQSGFSVFHDTDYFLVSYRQTADGKVSKTGAFTIDSELAYALSRLWRRSLFLSSAIARKPSGANHPVHTFYGSGFNARIGMITNPPAESMTGRMVAFASSLHDSVLDQSFDPDTWKTRLEDTTNSIPKITAPQYGEVADENNLEATLNEMQEREILHRFRSIRLVGYQPDDCPVFRSELIAGLEQIAPREWSALMESSGNMHNPKVIPIRQFLDQATIQTPTVARLNTLLADYGLRITGLSAEKLSFATQTKNGLPSGLFYFRVAGLDEEP